MQKPAEQAESPFPVRGFLILGAVVVLVIIIQSATAIAVAYIQKRG